MRGERASEATFEAPDETVEAAFVKKYQTDVHVGLISLYESCTMAVSGLSRRAHGRS